MANTKGLGKGLESLIPTDFDPSLLIDSNDRVQNLFISDIVANPDQPRKAFDEQALDELASSIKRYGILQPLIVSPHDGGYIVVAGERRWRAAQIAGLTKLPVIVRKPKQLEQLEIALIENVQRVDLSPFEQAVSIEKLHSQFNISYSEIAQRLGKAVSTVNNIVRLLQLPNKAIEALQHNKISEGHARAILALKADPTAQAQLLRSIIDHGWSVRQAEQFVVGIREGVKPKAASSSRLATTTPGTQKLSQSLHTPVSVRRTAKGGRLEIHFKDDTELEKLINQLLRG